MPAKPRVSPERTKLGALKWRCHSIGDGYYGPYVREGKGYTVEMAYRRWQRCGRRGAQR